LHGVVAQELETVYSSYLLVPTAWNDTVKKKRKLKTPDDEGRSGYGGLNQNSSPVPLLMNLQMYRKTRYLDSGQAFE
jgi:hypothetical protein